VIASGLLLGTVWAPFRGHCGSESQYLGIKFMISIVMCLLVYDRSVSVASLFFLFESKE